VVLILIVIIIIIIIIITIKVKLPIHAMKAQTESRGMVPHNLDFSARWRLSTNAITNTNTNANTNTSNNVLCPA
jgi:hypothetical protein